MTNSVKRALSAAAAVVAALGTFAIAGDASATGRGCNGGGYSSAGYSRGYASYGYGYAPRRVAVAAFVRRSGRTYAMRGGGRRYG
jgi:hypothetical protein